MVNGKLKDSRLEQMNTYFKRYAYPSKLFNNDPESDLTISVVIPCFNEPDIISTLSSLNACHVVGGTEVIIIINEAENCDKQITEQNQKTIDDINQWKSKENLNFSLLVHYLIATDKDAGVGFARKVGMDEAARRFENIDNIKGVICCFDADSTCSENYLQSISNGFYLQKPRPHGAAIYFEHPIPENIEHSIGIIKYELHLRYYVQALRYIGYPYAHQTVGSSMAVRSDIYQKVGGMNKRSAGEDFYFLHRVMPTGNFIDITDSVIYPSARISNRVPFGTGKVMEKWSKRSTEEFLTYNLNSFLDLKILFEQLDEFYKGDIEELTSKMPESIKAYFVHVSFRGAHQRLQKQSSSLDSFTNNWYQYFDGFRVLKYLHFARDNFYEDVSIITQAERLAKLFWNESITVERQPIEWLNYFRNKDIET
jgi:glycosyltransferase involved in cell wall biosynthesis